MKSLLLIALTIIILDSCKNQGTEKIDRDAKIEFQEIINNDYQLIKPKTDLNEILILFGGYPEKAEDIKREFKIVESAKQKGIAVVFMNYNQKLWLEESQKQALVVQLQKIFEENNLPRTKIYIGGFSSGGIVALIISDYLSQRSTDIVPRGVFVVDSPIDLLALYRSSEKNIERNFSEPSVKESTWIIETLEKRFGNPAENTSDYENYSIYTSETDNFHNITNLKNIKIRFYSEPDTIWWKENRMADFDQMNAYYLERLSVLLKKSNFKQVEYIATENKGYRANGDRHPHSWSIVDKEKLVEWIIE